MTSTSTSTSTSTVVVWLFIKFVGHDVVILDS